MPARCPLSRALGGLIGNHDGVEARPQAAAPDVGVRDGLELEFVLFEQPPRPAFVDVLDPRLVEADAARGRSAARPSARGRSPRWRASPRSREIALTVSRTPFAVGHDERPGLIRVAMQRERRCQSTTTRAPVFNRRLIAMLGAVAAPVDDVDTTGLRTSPQTFAGGIVARSSRVVAGGSKY